VVVIYWVFVAQYRVAVVVASTPPGAPMARISVGMHWIVARQGRDSHGHHQAGQGGWHRG